MQPLWRWEPLTSVNFQKCWRTCAEMPWFESGRTFTRFDEAWDGSKIHDLMPTFSFVCFSFSICIMIRIFIILYI